MPYIRLPDGTFKRINDGTPVDSSLSLKGAAADAKAVGELKDEIKKEVDSIKADMTQYATEDFVVEKLDNVVTAEDGEVKDALVAQANSNYSARQMRNVILVAEGEDIPSGQNGDICLVYEV